MTKRIDHIDNAKAIGMMLITASHVWVTANFSHSDFFICWDALLNSFYVPLFFILSGVFESKQFDFTKLKSRILHLIKIILIFMAVGLFVTWSIRHDWSIGSCISGSLVWFLITLLWITIIFNFAKRVKHNPLAITILMGGVGIWCAYNHHSYFYLGQAALCLPFYAIGYYLKEWITRESFNMITCLTSFVIWCLTIIVFYRSPQNISLNMVTQNSVTFYIAALTGSISVIEFSKLIRGNIMAWYGRNSLIPMMVQLPIITIVAKFIIADNVVIYFSLSLLVIILTGLFIPVLCNRYFNIFK